MIKKLLIVGGTGFIGRKLAQYSLRFNFNTYILSKNKVKGKDKLSDINYIKCDCTNVKELTQKISKIKFDYVINSSGYINHNPYSSKIGKKTFEEHFEVVKNLVSILNRGNLKKFLQIGSSDEYGNSPSPQSENYRENPISPYSFGKVASTHFLQMLNRTEQFKSTTVRIFLAYGPGQNFKRFFPQIIIGCLKDQKFPTSEGNQKRDFCYIDDVVEAVFKILISKKTTGKVLNIGSGKGIKIKDLIKKTVKLIGKGKPQFGKIPYRKGENMSLVADLSNLKKLIKWKPKFSIDHGIARTIKFYEKESRSS